MCHVSLRAFPWAFKSYVGCSRSRLSTWEIDAARLKECRSVISLWIQDDPIFGNYADAVTTRFQFALGNWFSLLQGG